jgi:glycosyltransferase involved in cell wall biosynthesis
VCKVSIITPTYNRELFHTGILECVLSQSYENLEWLVLDDSPAVSKALSSLNQPNLRYVHLAGKRSIGEKRNWLVEQATGEIIVHFDDDDFYAHNYVDSIVGALTRDDLDFLNLRAWFLLDRRNDFFGYWNLLDKTGLHYRCRASGIDMGQLNVRKMENNHLGWGFGFAYRRKVWQHIKFPPVDWNEDGEFSVNAQRAFKCGGFFDTHGLCLHCIHASNSSTCYSQFKLPTFLLTKIFPTLNLPSADDQNRTALPVIGL